MEGAQQRVDLREVNSLIYLVGDAGIEPATSAV